MLWPLTGMLLSVGLIFGIPALLLGRAALRGRQAPVWVVGTVGLAMSLVLVPLCAYAIAVLFGTRVSLGVLAASAALLSLPCIAIEILARVRGSHSGTRQTGSSGRRP